MEKKHQQASLLSESPSEPDVPDLELVPPIKNKKRLRRIKLSSNKSNEPSSVSFSIGNNLTMSKTKSACVYVTVGLVVVSLVVANIYLTYLLTETRLQLQLLGNKMAKLHADNIEIYDAKISAVKENAINEAVVKAYELLNSTITKNAQMEAVSGTMAHIMENVSLIKQDMDSVLKRHEQTLTTLFANVTDLRDTCLMGCGTILTNSDQTPTPKVGGRP